MQEILPNPGPLQAAPLKAPPLKAPWRIGVDIGGTFTDLVLVDAAGAVRTAKSPSVPADPAAGVMQAVALAAAQLGLDRAELLSQCELFIHGSTIATNTMLEGRGAKLGLLATEGFRDTLEIRRGLRDDPFDHRAPWPEVLVPRSRRSTVAERIDRDGAVERPLAPAALDAAIEELRGKGCAAVAICLLNSFLNDTHEQACEARIRALWPEVWISRSTAVAPVIGEYARSATTAADAYVGPLVVPYLQALDAELRASGLPGRLSLVQSNGGILSVAQVAARPISLVLSGPAAGVGALKYLRRAIGSGDLICIEIGGTSCDVTLMQDGTVAMTDGLSVAGQHLSVPSVEIHTVGAGGGTIAHCDAGGMLQVGPRGAGARPGPACYGLGGEAATVTDAQLVLGRLRSGRYAGGLIDLDPDLARAAVDRLARPLGIDTIAAAAGIVRLMEQKVRHAVEQVSIERGYDPRRFTVVAGGGAGAMHAAAVARALGCRGVYVPRLAGLFCAFGMCHADMRHDFQRTWLRDLDRVSAAEVDAAFAGLEAQGRALLDADGLPPERIRLQRAFGLRYQGQQWALPVETGAAFAAAGLRAGFEAAHERLYGHVQPDGRIEIVDLRLAATGLMPKPEMPAAEPDDAAPQPAEIREVYVAEAGGLQSVPVFDGAALRCGQRLAGPALIEETSTTLVLGAGDRLEVDPFGNYAIRFPEVPSA
ncbi:hydantoinase/oxoprolinase family protein [Marinibaculum pumilum]|uniref:Hydantoinase/oxoprolinase family protein n=1 Tax=Marinibaculum pumilum TaxID=1766165 RepID=A0ABV7L553_9PROT